ncbi:DNA-repair protein XRCC1 isoform X2 [Cornus florida]|uniref:DNA-repair protein XRCC1 isoform X2 n=1 Tax=Cornus florida TaxID=4283 RepID=UPI0028992A5D|nr:DNA-repair protein XRCC1 isoform X2 [Cornus florida]
MASPDNGANKTVKRNLPSWMSSRDSESKSNGNGVVGPVESSEGETREQAKECGKEHGGSAPSKKNQRNVKSSSLSLDATNFPKLLEGVVFVLSGFVNPERSVLRSQALEMGAEYQPDWNSDCTLLVCAFPNTPKFRQVEADCGTIVSKEWISECYTQKKLVDIESYLMHVGRPWRKQNISLGVNQDQEASLSMKSQKPVETKSRSGSTTSASSKIGASNPAKEHFSPSKVKKWATEDLNKTISWLESQEEKPEPSEIKKVAAEGILTCLQDAIDVLKQKQEIQQITEQWNFIPRVVEELAKLEGNGNSSASFPKEDLYKQAMACKRIYKAELSSLDDDLSVKKKLKTDKSERSNKDVVACDAAAYDSDETIEMTEEEIDLAYSTIASKLSKP